MAAARAYWKGYLKLSLVSCPIALALVLPHAGPATKARGRGAVPPWSCYHGVKRSGSQP